MQVARVETGEMEQRKKSRKKAGCEPELSGAGAEPGGDGEK